MAPTRRHQAFKPRSWITLQILWTAAWILLLGCKFCDGSWMYLGVSSLAGSLPQKDQCDKTPGLVSEQLQVCRKHPGSLLCVSHGARQAIQECQSQFRFERWNCTTLGNHSVFGPILRKGTRETAFIYAVLSAGVVHSVTQACSVGNLTDCSCDMSRYGQTDLEGWKWGGCSDNVEYGLYFSEEFVDAPDKGFTLEARESDTTKGLNKKKSRQVSRKLMNLHNNKVGRTAVKQLMSRKCRCHGVSGSCAVKTCWRGLPSFREIGRALKESYERSVRLATRAKRLRRKDRRKRRVPISHNEMVHLRRSPNYCRNKPSKGILGTNGRVCNRTSTGPDSCDLLCCGRGYNTQVIRQVERCHCKFHWCCYVECKRCESFIDVHTCK